MLGQTPEIAPPELSEQPEPSVPSQHIVDYANLPKSYSKIVEDSYHLGTFISDIAIDRELLPDSYMLPSQEDFFKRAVALQPTFEAFDRRGWEPEIVFTPRDLLFEQWDRIMSDSYLGGLKGCGRSWDAHAPSLLGLPASASTKEWDIAVISGADGLQLDESRFGKENSSAEGVIQSLGALPTAGSVSLSPSIIRRFSPSHDAYFTLQLSHLTNNAPPLDANVSTMANETITINTALRKLYLSYNPAERQLESVHDKDLRHSANDIVIRPTVYGRDLVPADQDY